MAKWNWILKECFFLPKLISQKKKVIQQNNLDNALLKHRLEQLSHASFAALIHNVHLV